MFCLDHEWKKKKWHMTACGIFFHYLSSRLAPWNIAFHMSLKKLTHLIWHPFVYPEYIFQDNKQSKASAPRRKLFSLFIIGYHLGPWSMIKNIWKQLEEKRFKNFNIPWPKHFFFFFPNIWWTVFMLVFSRRPKYVNLHKIWSHSMGTICSREFQKTLLSLRHSLG